MFDQLLKTGFTVTPIPDGGFEVRPLTSGATASGAPVLTAAETLLRGRWLVKGVASKHNAITLVDELRAQGHTLQLAEGHGGKASKQTYMHLTGLSKSGHPISAFINTGVVRVNDKWGISVVSSLQGAAPRPNGTAVAFDMTYLDECRGALKALFDA